MCKIWNRPVQRAKSPFASLRAAEVTAVTIRALAQHLAAQAWVFLGVRR